MTLISNLLQSSCLSNKSFSSPFAVNTAKRRNELWILKNQFSVFLFIMNDCQMKFQEWLWLTFFVENGRLKQHCQLLDFGTEVLFWHKIWKISIIALSQDDLAYLTNMHTVFILLHQDMPILDLLLRDLCSLGSKQYLKGMSKSWQTRILQRKNCSVVVKE